MTKDNNFKLSKEQINSLVQKMSKNQTLNKEQIQHQGQKVEGYLNRFLKFLSSLVGHIDRFINFIIKEKDENRNEVIQHSRSVVLFGVYVILIFFGFGFSWAALAPLDSAAGATGILIADSNKQLIQHKRGGYLEAIYVKVGEKVTKGQKLLQLSDPESSTRLAQTLNNYLHALAMEARLLAEKDNKKEVSFSKRLISAQDNRNIKIMMDNQRKLFYHRMDAFNSKIDSSLKHIDQIKKQIHTLENKEKYDLKALNTFKSRLYSTQTLVKKGHATKMNLEEAELQYERAKNEYYKTKNDIIVYNSQLSQNQSELKSFKSEYFSKIIDQLKEVTHNIISYKEEVDLLQDTVKKETITSPVDGVVNVINVHTIGSFISPHAQQGAQDMAIMTITPANEKLIIDARIPQSKIASVKVGLKAKIKFSAYKSRTSPTFIGTVVSMSSDSMEDPRAYYQMPTKGLSDDQSFYSAKIEIDMEEFNKIAKKRNLTLQPGMRAEIMIITGKRTLLRYLLDPLTDNMFRAFNEK